MSTDQEQLLLQRRAARHARPLPETEDGEWRWYLECSAGRLRVGLPARRLVGVSRLPPITPMPGSGSVLRGVAQVRGKLVAVVDVAALLDAALGGVSSLLVLVEGPRGPVGLQIETSERLRQVFANQMCRHLPEETDRDFVRAVTHDRMHLIDLDRLLDSPRLRVAGAAHQAGRPEGLQSPGNKS